MPGPAGDGLYNNARVLAMVPALSVMADYSLTFFYAQDIGEVLQYEFSPVVRFAAEYGIVPMAIVALVIAYYLLSYGALRALCGTCVYPFAVGILVTVSLTHLMGGFSWLVRLPFYSYMVHGLTITTLLLAGAGLIWGLFRCPAQMKFGRL